MSNSLHDPRYARLIELMVEARNNAALTQRDLAARLKVTPSYIGKVESRQRRLDLVELLDILNAIGVAPTDFMTVALRELRRRS